MKILLIAPFHERSFKKLAEITEYAYEKIYLPLPVELCRNPRLLDYLPSWFNSYIRIWQPLVNTLIRCPHCICYSEFKNYEEAFDTIIKLITLVYKARVFNKIDSSEWFEILPKYIKPTTPTSWSGVLVIDKFTEYVLLHSQGVSVDQVIVIEELIPTPLELLLLARAGIIKWKCGIEELIKWIVEYMGNILLSSTTLTEAYDKLRTNSVYLDLVFNCSSEISNLLSLE